MGKLVNLKEMSGGAGVFFALLLTFCLVCTPALARDVDGHTGGVVLDGDTVMPLTVVTVKYGASWDYGSIPVVHGWSNLSSGTRWHSSTVTATGKSAYSGSTQPGVTSFADLWWAAPTFNAYYDIW